MARLLVLCPDRIAPLMAGTAARYLEMTRALSRRHEVLLALPAPASGHDLGRVRQLLLEDPRLPAEAASASAVLAQGYAVRKLAWLRDMATPLIVDLYDPAPLENLEIASSIPEERSRQSSHEECLGFTIEQLLYGDFFLAGHERARDFWLGMLAGLGRVDPAAHARDPSMRALVDVLPTAAPGRPPVRTGPGLRDAEPAIGKKTRLIVWGGGIWDWMDAPALIEAFAGLASRKPLARLAFLGTTHPNPDVPPMAAAARAAELAERTGLLGTRIFFGEWVPYAARQNFLLDADLSVSLHGEHLEARFAWRTRHVDTLWCALPSIVSRGDSLAGLMESRGAAVGVDPGDRAGLTAALERLVDNSALRLRMRRAAAQLAGEMTWERALEPLERFLSEPYTTRRRDAPLRYVDYLKEFLPHRLLHSARMARVRNVYQREGGRGVLRRVARRAARSLGL